MSTSSATASPPRFAALALNMMRAVLPGLQVLDTLFPTAPFLLADTPAELTFFASNMPDEAAEFYARFRQSGGTQPILPFAAALPGALEAATAADQPLLVALHTTNAVDAAASLRQAESLPPLLLLAPEGDNEALQALRDIGYTGRCFFRLIQDETDEGFCLLSAETETAVLLRSLETAGKTAAVDMRFASHDGDEPDTLMVFLPPGCQTWTQASLNPFSLVHDGTKTPEGDRQYAWLWFSGEPHARILLGPTAQRFRRVRVIVPNALTTQNLRAMRLLINGTAVQPHVEVWSERSGCVSAELPDTLEAPLVLGLWVPEGHVPEGGNAKLFVCIDRIELSS
ncbi:hypothetical protein [Acidocella aromatica]|uniref:Uncharacterized protein n=1 Tax=Acidocella aromatica TaxID=1303579 RepID=A0A840VAF9_9PROT|nr:hypothetical protein [Acidocella aromatica]MBB5372753.1 hypothetical protein [Acidocella aromatica]